MKSAIPEALRRGLLALVVLAGAGTTVVVVDQAAVAEAQRNAYIQAVAADPGTSEAVKIAMVMGAYYESSYRHIGTPYIDKLGRGQPLTVCNGITGAGVVAGKTYAPADCYAIEKGRYLAAEKIAVRVLGRWQTYGPFAKATFLDFIHNKGEANFLASTMLRKANAGDLVGACAENPRWNRGTVGGVSMVLPGLELRGKSNAEICSQWTARTL